MSYNVDTVDILTGSLSIRSDHALSLYAMHRDRLPEDCFLHDIAYRRDLTAEPTMIPITRFSWRGDGSGHAYDLLPEIAKYLIGTADLLFVWEHGDSITGLRIQEGRIIRCRVVQRLEPEE